jgi:hypothetical protein
MAERLFAKLVRRITGYGYSVEKRFLNAFCKHSQG